MTSPEKHFDVLDYVKKSKALGVKEELAEYQARQLSEVIDFAAAAANKEFNFHELATKTDIKQLEVATKTDIKQLETDIKQLELRTTREIKQLELTTTTEIKQLDVKIERYRYDSLKFTLWTGVGVSVFLLCTLGGLMVKGFHLF